MDSKILILSLRNEADAWSKANGGSGDISSLLRQAADEIERLRAALQRIADDTSEQIVGSLNCRDVAWAALHPENVVKVIDH